MQTKGAYSCFGATKATSSVWNLKIKTLRARQCTSQLVVKGEIAVSFEKQQQGQSSPRIRGDQL